MTTIYHNPRCRKSRDTLDLLKSEGVTPEIRLYLQNPPSFKELELVLKQLDIPAKDLIRKGESIYKDQFKDMTLNEDEWLQAMVDHPKLIERPIVIHGNKASIGRPPEQVLSLF